MLKAHLPTSSTADAHPQDTYTILPARKLVRDLLVADNLMRKVSLVLGTWIDPAEVKSTKELSDEVVTQTSKALIAADVQGTALNPATEAATWPASLVPPIHRQPIYLRFSAVSAQFTWPDTRPAVKDIVARVIAQEP
ncbi:hypothetical protein E4U57_005638 [Claviceps arundinis]|uniref:Uncharacterized protein n=1 Tax=Claviceps arundinis TaxID=1623583 RepID=A0A9P7SPN3_9HYPO|nr:hypothetical protein E4U57_005638 [Claviceps arundinis]KAG5969589.1 hypothetical protein E4U56_008260 [Claviceps arundinis]